MVPSLLIPAAVFGCAVFGVIAAALWFGAAFALFDWLSGKVLDDAAAASLGYRASLSGWALGAPVGAWAGFVLSVAALYRSGPSSSSGATGVRDVLNEIGYGLVGVFAGVLLALALTLVPLYFSFWPALRAIMAYKVLGYGSVLLFGMGVAATFKRIDAR
jgi:hypothetical protein